MRGGFLRLVCFGLAIPLRHFAMFYFQRETGFDAGEHGQNVIQHLLRRRPEFSAARAHFDPARFVAVIALSPSLGADENGVAVVGEFHICRCDDEGMRMN